LQPDAIIFDDVTKEFPADGRDEGRSYGVLNLSFQVQPGEMVAIVGQTGCGKSTAFNLLVGLMRPTSGRVLVGEREPYKDFQAFRSKFGIVFQNDRLLPWRVAIDNVAVGLEVMGVPKATRLEIAGNWLERVGLAGYERKYPHELSGGMKQRVSIARAFAMDPSIILCDESFSALDELTALKLRQRFIALVRENAKTGLFITHSIQEAIEMGQRILVFIKPGQVAREFVVPPSLDPAGAAALREAVLEGMEKRDLNAVH
jgi:NitT/TauT family transport system ATP-binding protein